MGWSWFLANDMQFFGVGLLILAVTMRWRQAGTSPSPPSPPSSPSLSIFLSFSPLTHLSLQGGWARMLAGVTISALVVVAGAGTNTVISWYYGYRAGMNNGGGMLEPSEGGARGHGEQQDLYLHPWNRIGPYALGMGLAFILAERRTPSLLCTSPAGGGHATHGSTGIWQEQPRAMASAAGADAAAPCRGFHHPRLHCIQSHGALSGMEGPLPEVECPTNATACNLAAPPRQLC
jgi:hypothetical protein